MKKCSKCGEDHKDYRDPCFSCIPRKKAGRKNLGPRARFTARLTNSQMQDLSDRYDGSLQVMVDKELK